MAMNRSIKLGLSCVRTLPRLFCTGSNPETLSRLKPTKVFGQPSPLTHPHLLKDGEVTPGITAYEYRQRRQRLMETIDIYKLANVDHHIVFVLSANKHYMTEKIPYPFRQHSDICYLSGFLEPDSLLMLHTLPGKKLPTHRSVLFVPKKDVDGELWDGPRTGADAAPELLGVDSAHTTDELAEYLEIMLKDLSHVCLWYDPGPLGTTRIKQVIQEILPQRPIEPIRPLIHQLRLIKSSSEIELMSRTCQTAGQALNAAISRTQPGINEQEVTAMLQYDCVRHGAQRMAYPPVVASGVRTCTIHYSANNMPAEAGDLFLVDVGCELNGYNSDITRTWPVTGKFTTYQKVLYEMLLSLQLELIDKCRDRVPLDTLFGLMCQRLGHHLRDIGVIGKTTPDNQLAKIAYFFCPHHVGHYLGIDVHDTPLIPRNIPLKPGMVITIEPGLYIRPDNKGVPPEFRGLAMRIEDDVVITDSAVSVLSRGCKKSVEDLEKLCGSAGRP